MLEVFLNFPCDAIFNNSIYMQFEQCADACLGTFDPPNSNIHGLEVQCWE